MLQDALVDGAELLNGEIAVVDVACRATIPPVEMRQPEHEVGHRRICKLDAAEDWSRAEVEEAAVVGRDAERVIADRDRPEHAVEARPVRLHAVREA